MPSATKHLENALQISEELGDTVSLFFAHYWLGGTFSFDCDFERSLYHLGKSLDINIAANSLWGISAVKCMINLWVYDPQGKVQRCYENAQEAVQLAEKSGDIFSKAKTYTVYGASCAQKGFFETATEYLTRGAAFCERINYRSYNSFAEQYLGEVCVELGKYQESIHHYEKAAWLLETSRTQLWWTVYHKIAGARARVMNNEKDIDLESLYGHVYKNKHRPIDGCLRRCIGEILLDIDDQHMSQGQEWIEKAIEADTRNGMVFQIGHDYAVYAQVFKSRGDSTKAKENLAKAIEIYKECGADGWVEKAEKELASIS